ncbi:thioredoxin reductase 1, cytoplasmic [Folsomia candida]|uniref:thioredoxin-disulfide reductase (NADPH) n=1 Tax=Folsomia candida TaxID=158441 RepID=A0A226DQ85_FOLCA|nr:thioredoxin reductase 1, cytoplasmic [Folsomia candida]OXA46366.1 Thioredoxin reductase 1, cytoplasmic [Folsomia candida]
MLLFRQFSTFSSKLILTSSTTTTCNLTPLLQAQQKLLVVTKSTMSSSASPSPTKGSKYDYDLIVIGGGSGGLAASKEAAALGAKVALLDFVPESPQGTTWGLGGTCVNVGCIPKKMMHVASLVGKNISDASSYGWTSVDTSKSKSVDWPALVQNVQDRIKGTNWTYRVALRDSNVTYINGLGEFVDANTIKATTKQGKISIHTASNILIAVGGRPHYPEDVPGAKQYCLSSDDIFSLQNHPGKTLVVGGSYIALETAGFLQGLGIDTTIMVRSILLRGFDQQMADLVGKYMEDECHVKFQVGRVPVSVKEGKPGSSNQRTLIVSSKPTSGAGSVVEEEFNTVMFATGRLPITPGLKLGPVGVKVDESGFVLANESDQTSVPNIYAIGDCTKGRPELTPAAIQAGLLLARRLFGKSTTLTDYVNCPTTVFTPMEYAFVGFSEEDAIKKFGKDDIEVYHTYFQPFESQLPASDLNKGYAKVVCRKSEKERVVGLHFIGYNAGEVVQGFAVAIRLGMKKNDLNATIGIHPTSAENFTIIMNISKSSGKDAMKKGCCG